ncbi:hypothetical protein D3C87_1672270 [compost metagenome]
MHTAADINHRTLCQPFFQFLGRLLQAILHVDLLGLIPREGQVETRQIAVDQPFFQFRAAEEIVLTISLAKQQPLTLLTVSNPRLEQTA